MSAYHYGNLAWAKQKTNGGSGRRRLQSHTSSALSWPMSATQQYSYNKEDAMDTETDSPSHFGHPEQLHKVCSDGDAPFYRPQPRHHKEISPPTSQTSRRSSSSYFSPPMHNGYTTTTTTTTISEDTLGAIIENYYQDLLFALLQGNEPLAKEVLQRFWREEVCYELERRSVREIMQSEQKGAVNLMVIPPKKTTVSNHSPLNSGKADSQSNWHESLTIVRLSHNSCNVSIECCASALT